MSRSVRQGATLTSYRVQHRQRATPSQQDDHRPKAGAVASTRLGWREGRICNRGSDFSVEASVSIGLS